MILLDFFNIRPINTLQLLMMKILLKKSGKTGKTLLINLLH
nr:MAG TPA: EutP [Caudoviricetes sp.]